MTKWSVIRDAVRDIAILSLGIYAAVHEINSPPPFDAQTLILVAGCLGLPIYLRSDEKDKDK